MQLPTSIASNRWFKSAEAKTLYGGRLNIRHRLILGFVFIVLSMLAAYAVVAWQFHSVQGQAERLNDIDQKLVAVLRVHISLLAFHDRLEGLADSRDLGGLLTEGELLRTAVLDDTHRAINALNRPPFDPQQDPTILPTLYVIQSALTSQLEAIATLARSADWRAVHLRLANQVAPLESLASALVENVDREVGEEQAQTELNIRRVQRLVILILPLTALFTLLVAATLGAAITRSITQPLARLVEGSRALARGDFQHRVSVSGNDELAHLGQVFNDTVRRLRDLYATLRRSEAFLAQGQSISHTGSFGWIVPRGEIHWSEETYKIFGYDQSIKPELELIFQRIHPDDRDRVQQTIDRDSAARADLDFEHRLLMPDASIKHLHILARALQTPSGDLEYVGAITDVTAAERTEATLRESEAYLAEAQRLSHTGSWAWDPATTKTTYMSEECYRVLGLDPQGEMLSLETALQRIHPDDSQTIAEKVERATHEREEFELDYRYCPPGGEFRDIHQIGHPVLSPSGDLVEFVGTVMDVTAAKQAGEALRRSESYLAEAQRLTHTGSGVWSVPGWEPLYLSEEWYRIYGFDSKQGLSAWEGRLQRMHPEDEAKVQEAKDRAVIEKSDYEVDHRIVLPDGTVKYTHTVGHPVLNASGEVKQFVCTMMDVTERKRAEETLRESEAYLAEAQRLSHAGSWAWAPATGEIRYCSEECYRVLGIDPQGGQPRFETLFERIHPDDQPRIAKTLERATRERVEFEVDDRIVYPGGEIRDVHVVGHPVLSPSGDLVEFVGTLMDVTERKRAEEERERLRQVQDDLAHLSRVATMGELTASLAHEIRQPIAAAATDARTCLRWLGRDQPEVAEACEAAARIVKDVTRAADIIGRISALFKKGAPQRELVDVNELIQEMFVLLRSEANRHSISIRAELAADLPKVMADPVQLQQVFMNLMLNGIDAMKGTTDGRELTIKSEAGDAQLLISVSDTGVGFPPEQAEQIFRAFVTTKDKGTGMGLPISRSIIESHGGRLWAASASGRGATFHFTLPATHAAHA
jgi:PAS domain S-box-containing protein